MRSRLFAFSLPAFVSLTWSRVLHCLRPRSLTMAEAKVSFKVTLTSDPKMPFRMCVPRLFFFSAEACLSPRPVQGWTWLGAKHASRLLLLACFFVLCVAGSTSINWLIMLRWLFYPTEFIAFVAPCVCSSSCPLLFPQSESASRSAVHRCHYLRSGRVQGACRHNGRHHS